MICNPGGNIFHPGAELPWPPQYAPQGQALLMHSFIQQSVIATYSASGPMLVTEDTERNQTQSLPSGNSG